MFPTSYSLIGPAVLLTTWFIIKGLQNMVIQIISELPYTIKSWTPRQDRNINSNIYHKMIRNGRIVLSCLGILHN